MLEKRIERRVVEGARQAGGLAIKWSAPAFAGVPDRIVFLPGGRIILVEVKAPGCHPSPLQQRVHLMLSQLGADVRVVDSLEAADALYS
jgi:hypothetical protein